MDNTAVNKPELVSPAGDWPSLVSALESGADSVYFGVKSLNMRDKADNFGASELNKISDFIHSRGRKGYLALNVIVSEKELGKVRKVLRAAKSAQVDAVILWDMAVLSIAKELGIPVHLSTQAGVLNSEALSFFSRIGVKRAVLAREAALSDIKDILTKIEERNLDVEIEAFVHGAMCVSISGRCFLSAYSFDKPANKGECLQPCRREFLIKDTAGEAEYLLGKDYLLSPKDLCAMPFIEELIESGIKAFKIEGRMRPPEYVRIVTSSYRRAIDAYYRGGLTEKVKDELTDELVSVYNRGFSAGFYFGKPEDWISRGLEHKYRKVFLGNVRKFYKKIMVAELEVRNREIKQGQEILFIGKSTPAEVVKVTELQKDHLFVDKAVKGERVGVKLPFIVKPKDKAFIWEKIK